jgi:NTP pyrophosphatase (non-canonical NTP hydrolase)
MMRRVEFYEAIRAELDRAYAKHGRDPWGRHEFYAILLEEVDELWDAIKSDAPNEEMVAELVQVAAMCFRFWETGGDKYALALLADKAEGRLTKPPLAVAWAVTCDGDFTNNIFTDRVRAQEALDTLNREHPQHKRTLVALVPWLEGSKP